MPAGREAPVRGHFAGTLVGSVDLFRTDVTRLRLHVSLAAPDKSGGTWV